MPEQVAANASLPPKAVVNSPPRPSMPAGVAPPTAADPFIDRPQNLLKSLCRLTGACWGALALLTAGGELEDLFVEGPGGEGERQQAAEIVRRIGAQEESGSTNSPGFQPGEGLGVASAGGPSLILKVPGPVRRRGVLCLARAVGQPKFTKDEAEAVRLLCSWLQDGEMLQERQLRRRLHLLNQIAQAAASGLNLTPLLQAALSGLDREMPLYPGAVWLLEEPAGDLRTQPADQARREECPPRTPGAPGDRLSRIIRRPKFTPAETSLSLILAQLSPGAATCSPFPEASRFPVGQTPFAAALTAGEPYYAELPGPNSPPADELDRSAQLLGLGDPRARACLAVPLRASERTVGILQCVCERPSGFSSDFVQLVYLVADLLGPAVSNCQMFERLGAAYEALRVAQARLVQSEKMRALAEMAAGMAHEFNNALCGTLGFIELALRDNTLPVTVRRHLEAARTSALDAAHTVRRVQSFARPNTTHTAEQGVVDIDELVRQVAELAHHKSSSLDRVRSGGVAIEVHAGARRGVLGNATELREVLLNLAFNGIDAMPSGGTLTLRTWSDGPWVCLAVSDTGVGIPEHARARLFEPFFTTKGERGNGLGLSVVFGIVQRHGGDIQVESEPGKGATFTVRFPAACAEAIAPSRTLEGGALDLLPSGLRILVVEDEETVSQFLVASLRGLGYHVALTRRATEALQVLERDGPFDLVLTDLGLPGTSGEELARAIARGRAPVPVVLLTGWAGQIQQEKRQPEGVVRILSKPITLATLETTLRDVCSRRNPNRPGALQSAQPV